MLLERGVRVVGTDGWSWDVPLLRWREEFEKNHDASIIWEPTGWAATRPTATSKS